MRTFIKILLAWLIVLNFAFAAGMGAVFFGGSPTPDVAGTLLLHVTAVVVCAVLFPLAGKVAA